MTAALVLSLLLAQPPEPTTEAPMQAPASERPPVQRPSSTPSEPSEPSEPSTATSEPEIDASEPPTEGPAEPGSAEVAPEVAPTSESGPPFYTPEDMQRLRERYELRPDPQIEPRRPKWRCLIPDPVCGFGVELLATSAYAYRIRQGDISVEDAIFHWSSARVAYEIWVDFPAHVETIGKHKFTRFTLGPKGGIIASDNSDMWANFGIAGRYWFGRGAWAPALEFSSALAFRLMHERNDRITSQRGPVGITADFGINIGGWGAIIVGGQYDTPLAREDLPERYRLSAAGQVFVGFRGNVLWGAPAAAAVGTHAAIQRALPNQP